MTKCEQTRERLVEAAVPIFSHRGFPGGCPILNTAVAADGNAIPRARVTKALRFWLRRLQGILGQAREHRETRFAVNPKAVADRGVAQRRSDDQPNPAQRRGAATHSNSLETVSLQRGGSIVMREMERLYLEDLRVGQSFTSATYVMESARIKEFAAEFDPQPFHLDEAAAGGSVFKGLAASGWHTAAVAMRLLVTGGLPFANGLVGLGGEVAWPQPTRPGDILRVDSEIVGITPSRSKPDRGIVTIQSTTLNQNGEAVYMLTAKLLVFRRGRIE